MENIVYQHPLYSNKHCFVILADYASNHDGTRLVHNAQSFGDDDYLACKKNIKVIILWKTNDVIINCLKQQNKILFHSEFTHSALIDWRT